VSHCPHVVAATGHCVKPVVVLVCVGAAHHNPGGQAGRSRRRCRAGLRAVSPAGVQIAAVAGSAPDDHLAPGPYCRVEFSATGCAGGAGGCPTVAARIISPAGIEIGSAAESAPDDHFAASPHCRVIEPASRRIGRGRGRPVIEAFVRLVRDRRQGAIASRKEKQEPAGLRQMLYETFSLWRLTVTR